MDEIEKRLREGSENCYNCYEVWKKSQKDSAAREALQEAIHELRKIASRLEIELAISERDEMAQRPIPIPPHRDATRRVPPQGGGEEAAQDFDESNFNQSQNFQGPRGPRPQGHGGGGQGRRRTLGRRSEGSGGGGSGSGGGGNVSGGNE